MRILIVAIEADRWGPARLPRALRAAGMSVAVLCPANNALAATGFLDRWYPLSETRSSGRMVSQLAGAIASWQPQLIVPADEQVVALLHFLVRRGPSADGLDAAALRLLIDLLGPPDRFDAMLLKSDTLTLARRLGVRVPEGGTVRSVDEATALAAEISYPIYLKTSFSWAGQGAVLCHDADELTAAMASSTSWVQDQGLVAAKAASGLVPRPGPRWTCSRRSSGSWRCTPRSRGADGCSRGLPASRTRRSRRMVPARLSAWDPTLKWRRR